VVKGNGNDVPAPYHAARRPDARAIHPHIAGTGKRGGVIAGTDEAGMPQPSVNPLALPSGADLTFATHRTAHS